MAETKQGKILDAAERDLVREFKRQMIEAEAERAAKKINEAFARRLDELDRFQNRRD